MDSAKKTAHFVIFPSISHRRSIGRRTNLVSGPGCKAAKLQFVIYIYVNENVRDLVETKESNKRMNGTPAAGEKYLRLPVSE